MIEYELIQQRQQELQKLAQHDRLVREAAAARRPAGTGSGALRRFARSIRRTDRTDGTAQPRAAHLSEC